MLKTKIKKVNQQKPDDQRINVEEIEKYYYICNTKKGVLYVNRIQYIVCLRSLTIELVMGAVKLRKKEREREWSGEEQYHQQQPGAIPRGGRGPEER